VDCRRCRRCKGAVKYSRSVERVDEEEAGAVEEEVNAKGDEGGHRAKSIVFGGREGKAAGYAKTSSQYQVGVGECRGGKDPRRTFRPKLTNPDNSISHSVKTFQFFSSSSSSSASAFSFPFPFSVSHFLSDLLGLPNTLIRILSSLNPSHPLKFSSSGSGSVVESLDSFGTRNSE